jgi:hypothetical protein
MIMKSPLRACRGTGDPQPEQKAALKKVSDESTNDVMLSSPWTHRIEPEGAKRLAAFDEPVILRQRRQ